MRQFANHDDFVRAHGMPAGMVYGPNHERVPVALIREQARTKLQGIIDQGKGRASGTIQRILNEVPEDRIVHAGAVRPIVEADGKIQIELSDTRLSMHRNAETQLLSRLGIPLSYADTLSVPDVEGKQAVDNGWRRDLLGRTMDEHLKHAGERYLVRSYSGQARGVLSDSFRRLDSRPLLEAFVGACGEIGAIPCEGFGSDVQMTVRAIFPEIFEPIEGECMVVGLAQTNSDYGRGIYGISAFALRLVCDNGLITESAFRQIHLGSKLPNDLTFSAETYRKDTDAMVSATRDIVKGILQPAAVERRFDAIRGAASKEITTEAAMRSVMKDLTKAEAKAVRDSFDGPDVIMLPPGKTEWRFSNALSWVANSCENPERKIELQAMAGKIVTPPKLAAA